MPVGPCHVVSAPIDGKYQTRGSVYRKEEKTWGGNGSHRQRASVARFDTSARIPYEASPVVQLDFGAPPKGLRMKLPKGTINNINERCLSDLGNKHRRASEGGGEATKDHCQHPVARGARLGADSFQLNARTTR